jgi:hypothetical protein
VELVGMGEAETWKMIAAMTGLLGAMVAALEL